MKGEKMPEFRNREEYEKWKSEKLKASREKTESSKNKPLPSKEQSMPTQRAPQGAPRNLRSLGELFNDAFEVYKERFGTFFGIIFFSVLLVVATVGIVAAIGLALSFVFPGKKQVVVAVGVLLGLIPFFAALFWGMAAFVFAVTDSALGIREAFGRGWRSVRSFMWLYSIMGFIITGGYLLFLVPGIIFSVWFAFCQFILARDDVRGMDALLRSREYVRDMWFEVFGRLAVVWLASLFLGAIPLLGPLFSLLFAPFVMVFTYLIYEDLAGIKGDSLSYGKTTGAKCKWVGVGALGYVVLPLIVIAMFGAAMVLPFLMLKGMLLSGDSRITLPAPDNGVVMPAPPSSTLPEGSGPGTLSLPAGPKAEATGEALIVRDGVQETYQLQTGFFSDTRMATPGRATVQFQLPAEPHSNARRIEITLDTTRTGEYIIDGKAMNDRMFGRSQDQTPLAATFQFVADGGQIYPPKETCRLVISSPYTGNAGSVFSGEIANCVVHSAGIDHMISAKFTVRGASSR